MAGQSAAMVKEIMSCKDLIQKLVSETDALIGGKWIYRINSIHFPGQRAEMRYGKDFYENSELAKEIFDTATAELGLDMTKLCFEENDKLNITEYTQICMLTTEAAIYTALQAAGIGCDVTAGLSLVNMVR